MIRNLINGFVYIGQTRDCFKNRFLEHNNRLTRGVHANKKLLLDWIKYGENNFVFEIATVTNNIEDLDYMEREYIKKYKQIAKSYNKKNGGDHVFVTEKGLMSISNYMTHRKVGDETKEKLRNINLGDKNPVRKICANDVIKIKQDLISHKNQGDIAKEYGVSLGLISAIANNRSWKHIIIEGWQEYLNSKKPRHYLTEEEIKEIKALLSEKNANQSLIARKFGVYSGTINKIYHKKYHNNDNTVPSSDEEKV